ncbi:MAG TPA: hypothetical protein DD426_05805 [Clostridiaceae bacterium]|nr:hypothetical protein [Clostridiaceae bacterium]
MKKLVTIILSAVIFLSGCSGQLMQKTDNEASKKTSIMPEAKAKNDNNAFKNAKPQISDEEMKMVELYTTVMKEAFKIENGGNGFIAVRLDTLQGLSDAAKERVLENFKDLSANIYSYEQIKDDNTKIEWYEGKFPNRTINGTILSVNLIKYKNNVAQIQAISWFGSLGAVLPKYEAVYKNGKWQLKTIGFAIS